MERIVNDSGIVRDVSFLPGSIEELAELLESQASCDVGEWLDRTESHLSEIIEPHLFIHPVLKAKVLQQDHPDYVSDAKTALSNLILIRKAIAREKWTDALFAVFELGVLIERIRHVRPHEPQVKSHKEGSRKGAEKGKQRGEQSRERIISRYEHLVQEHPFWKYQDVVREISRNEKVSEDSIRKHLKKAGHTAAKHKQNLERRGDS